MESLTSNPIQDLHLLNARLADFLVRAGSDSGESADHTAQALSDLLTDLPRGTALVKAYSEQGDDSEARSEIAQYRDYLAQLRDVLPRLQVRLLSERSRLEAQRCHLHAASAWAETTRKLI